MRILLPLAAVVMMLCYLITPDEPGREYDPPAAALVAQEAQLVSEIEPDEPPEAVADADKFCPCFKWDGGILATCDVEERHSRSSNFWW